MISSSSAKKKKRAPLLSNGGISSRVVFCRLFFLFLWSIPRLLSLVSPCPRAAGMGRGEGVDRMGIDGDGKVIGIPHHRRGMVFGSQRWLR